VGCKVAVIRLTVPVPEYKTSEAVQVTKQGPPLALKPSSLNQTAAGVRTCGWVPSVATARHAGMRCNPCCHGIANSHKHTNMIAAQCSGTLRPCGNCVV